jgi:hypothetical protein
MDVQKNARLTTQGLNAGVTGAHHTCGVSLTRLGCRESRDRHRCGSLMRAANQGVLDVLWYVHVEPTAEMRASYTSAFGPIRPAGELP